MRKKLHIGITWWNYTLHLQVEQPPHSSESPTLGLLVTEKHAGHALVLNLGDVLVCRIGHNTFKVTLPFLTIMCA